ncbi:rhamnan synthesis F family protein [Falsiroseomonas sp.]|uniref:rhamnan synthesis F family protein n=1 Tax=Falsiroseomonas sp. TaxID=2870721 RepID=UPI002732FADE|nr:rhamnan synthesis F family protein [Falsiroseomonas sp.]MDP3414618.1 rhamnan synthesis F family protein [Falsiroseomonas sp.]
MSKPAEERREAADQSFAPKRGALLTLGGSPLKLAEHVAQKLMIATAGRLFVHAATQRLRRSLAGRLGPVTWPNLRIALVVHAYYPELLSEVIACRDVLPAGTKLLVTVPADREYAAAAQLGGVPDASLYPVENRGRDIAPFMTLLNSGAFEPFDAVLKLHTKRSPQLRDGDTRRRLLFTLLAGEPHHTARILSAFMDPQVALVGWRAAFRTARPYWMGNESRVATLAQAMNAGDAARLGFFEGSMFWFRPAALDRLRRLDLTPVDFEAEAGQLDGTLHHALERLFTVAAWSDGYTVRALDGSLLSGGEFPRERAKSSDPAVP